MTVNLKIKKFGPYVNLALYVLPHGTAMKNAVRTNFFFHSGLIIRRKMYTKLPPIEWLSDGEGEQEMD